MRCGLFGRWYWAERVPRTSTAPLEGCTHIDEVLSAAPPDVEGSTLVSRGAVPRGAVSSLGRSSGGWTVLGEVDGVLRGVATLCY